MCIQETTWTTQLAKKDNDEIVHKYIAVINSNVSSNLNASVI